MRVSKYGPSRWDHRNRFGEQISPNLKLVLTHIPQYVYAENYFPFGRTLYGFYQGSLNQDAELQSFSFFPPSKDSDHHHLPCTTIELSIPYSFASSHREISGKLSSMSSHPAHVFSPDYGVFAVTLRGFERDGRQRSVIHFWPGHTRNGKLEIGPAHFHEHTDRIRQIAVGASGTHVLVLVYRGIDDHDSGFYLREGDGYLGLLHFDPTPIPHTTFRKLDIGDRSPRYINTMALDESLGLVLFVHRGKLVAFSYA